MRLIYVEKHFSILWTFVPSQCIVISISFDPLDLEIDLERC